MQQRTLVSVFEKIRQGEIREHLKGVRLIREFRSDEDYARLQRALQEDDIDIRIVAAEAIAYFDVPTTESALLPLLGDDEWEVQWAATRALGTYWQIPELKKMGHRLPHHRVYGLEAIRKKLDAKLLPVFLSRLDDEVEVVNATVQTLAELKHPGAIPALQELFALATKETKAFIEESLLRLGGADGLVIKDEDTLFCGTCELKFPISFMKKAKTDEHDVRWLCFSHFQDFTEQQESIKGKFKLCKMCKVHSPKSDVFEGLCSQCRESVFFSFPAVEEGFRCFHCHKHFGEQEKSPISKLFPSAVCHGCANKLSNQSAISPFLTRKATGILEAAFESGYMLCQKKQKYLPLHNFEGYQDFRDRVSSIEKKESVDEEKEV